MSAPKPDDGRSTSLFVDDRELRRRVAPHLGWDNFRAAIRLMELQGLPKIDRLWRGRYWPAVRAWFDQQNGLTQRPPESSPDSDLMPNLSPRDGYVYFAILGERIKIGYTTDWRQRLSSLQTGSPDQIHFLAVIRGERQTERDFHERFSHLRQSGEWFEAAPELREFIRALPEEERVR